MVDYRYALRGRFFDIAATADSPEEIARQARYVDDGLMFIAEGRIAALMSWEEGQSLLKQPDDWLDLRGKLIVPGFVDTHLHYPQTEMIGAFGEQLLEWLTTYTFPVESQYGNAGHAAQMSAFFLNQLFRTAPPPRWCLAPCTRNRSTRCLPPPRSKICGSSPGK